MKLKIKVKRLRETKLPKVISKGEWIDLCANDNVIMHAPQAGTLKTHKVNGESVSHRDVDFDYKIIPLGLAIKLPKGFEAHLLPRSSTYKNFGIIQANSQGIIDYTYSSNNDEWGFPAIALRDTVISKGDRICQFRIQLSQKATVWQKLKWLLSSGVKLIEVDDLGYNERGGFGSTGIN